MTSVTLTTTKRHPIRGFLYGIVLGLGLMLIVVGQGIAALGTWPPFLVLLAGIGIGTLWGAYGPAKAPKGAPPAQPEMIHEPEPAPEPEPMAEADAPPEPEATADPETGADAAPDAGDGADGDD